MSSAAAVPSPLPVVLAEGSVPAAAGRAPACTVPNARCYSISAVFQGMDLVSCMRMQCPPIPSRHPATEAVAPAAAADLRQLAPK